MSVISPVVHRPAQTITTSQFTSRRCKTDLLINLLRNILQTVVTDHWTLRQKWQGRIFYFARFFLYKNHHSLLVQIREEILLVNEGQFSLGLVDLPHVHLSVRTSVHPKHFPYLLDEPYARDLQAQGACALRFLYTDHLKKLFIPSFGLLNKHPW